MLRDLIANEHGITSIEKIMAIAMFSTMLLLAFFVLINGGIFFAEAGSGTISSGIQHAKTDLEIAGPVLVKSKDSVEVSDILFVVRNVTAGKQIDLTPSDGSAFSRNTMHVDLRTASDFLENIRWKVEPVISNNPDMMLEFGEQFEITIELKNLGAGKSLSFPISSNSHFTIVLKPNAGATITMQRTLPPFLNYITPLP